MLKLIKWNIIDFSRKYYWIFLGMAVSIFLVLIPANGKSALDAAMIFFSGLIGFLSFSAAIVLAFGWCFRWFENDSYLLELTLPVSSWKTIFCKLILAGLVNTVACVFFAQLLLFMGKYPSGSIMFLSLDQIGFISVLVLFLVLADSTIQFSYLCSKRSRVPSGWVLFLTGFLSLIIYGILTIICLSMMVVSGVLLLPVIDGKDIITMNGTLQVLSVLVPVCVGLAAVVLEYVGSCLLLDYRIKPKKSSKGLINDQEKDQRMKINSGGTGDSQQPASE